MTKEVRDYVAQKTKEMMEAFSCSAEAKSGGTGVAGCARDRE